MWGQHTRGPATPDASARRVDRWYEIALEGIKAFDEVTRNHRLLWPSKESIHRWLSRKHDVLFDALSRGDILPIDVLDAVLEIDVLRLIKDLVKCSPTISAPSCGELIVIAG